LSLGRATTFAAKDWLKANGGQAGFYRANYQTSEWERLRTAVEKSQLPTVDRLGLQNDIYALARAGFVPATHFLSFVQAYKGEADATVWRDLSANLRSMEMLLFDESYLEEFRRYAKALYTRIRRSIGWEPKPEEGHLDSLLRTTVLGQLGAYGDSSTVAQARSRFERFLSEPESLHPDLRGVVYGTVAQEGAPSTYESMWDFYKKAPLQEEKVRLLVSLARFKQPQLLQQTLERALGPDVRVQDTVAVVTSVAGNKHGRDLAWEFMKANWPELDRRYGKGGFAITRLVAITGSFTRLKRADEVKEFFRKHPTPSAERTIKQSLERIRLNARWLELNGQRLKTFFSFRK
jgi:puromycin-sensitive aminopeptidase